MSDELSRMNITAWTPHIRNIVRAAFMARAVLAPAAESVELVRIVRLIDEVNEAEEAKQA